MPLCFWGISGIGVKLYPVNLFPVTGVTLPLVSMGGSSFLFTCLAIGIILSVARNVEQLEAPANAPKAAGEKKEKKAAADAKANEEDGDENEEKPVKAKKEKATKNAKAAGEVDKAEKSKALKPLTDIAMNDLEQGK
jgi:cell division protein FtsW